MAEAAKCEVCGKVAGKKCGKCWNVFYCTKEHQQSDWKTHQMMCRPFKICHNKQLGRYIIATKPIKEGDVILQEMPLVTGPSQSTSVVCLGCLNTLDTDTIHPCDKCGWPLCSEICQTNPDHKPECYYFSKKGKKISPMDFLTYQNDFILILRCLYQKRFNPELWQQLNTLESHWGTGGNTEGYHTTLEMAIEQIHNVFRLKKAFSEEDIQKVCGIINVNSFTTDTEHVAIYDAASFFEHSCKPNCRKVFNSKRMLRVIAATSIDEGDHLSISYIGSLRTTFDRQARLQATKLFKCLCERCMDVTEFGTYFSALKCQDKDCQGFLLPETFLTEGLDWVCNKCNAKETADSISCIYKCIELDFEGATDCLEYQSFLTHQKDVLPDNHCYIIKAKMEILATIGSTFSLRDIPDDDLSLKMKLCKELLEFIQIIAPAEKGIRGDILYHLQTSLAEVYRRKENAEEFSYEDRLRILKERESMLKEVVDLSKFKYDEEFQHEMAKVELKITEENLRKLEASKLQLF